MNKYIKRYKRKDTQISSFALCVDDEPGDVKAPLIGLIRSRFFCDHDQSKLDCDLNIKYGYYQGYRISKAINELLLFIKFCKPLLSINKPEHPQITNDEKCIARLILCNFESEKTQINNTQNLVPEKESETLIRLAKAVNLSLS